MKRFSIPKALKALYLNRLHKRRLYFPLYYIFCRYQVGRIYFAQGKSVENLGMTTKSQLPKQRSLIGRFFSA